MADAPEKTKSTNVDSGKARQTRQKKNPLKNSATLFKLNPYAKTQKRNAQIEQEKRMKKKEASKTN